VFGQWAWAAWIMLICNMVLPLSLWSQKLRRNPSWLFILSLFINIGMWFERRDRRTVALAVRAVAMGLVSPDLRRLRHPDRLRLVLHGSCCSSSSCQ
jgi:hypothetical protein